MRKYIYSLLAFTAIVSFASCSSEDNNIAENGDNTKVMTFTATQEDNAPATRTAISSTNNKAIVWKSGDQISVFDGSKNNQFTLKSGEETNSATFGGTAAASATTYTAVYPYQSEATLSGNSVNNVTLKATQTATPGSFDKTTALMMAQGKSTNLSFKNAVGYVKVTPKFDCKKIELKAADGDVALAGTGTLTWNEGNPKIVLTEGLSYTITLDGDMKKGTSYYIAVPAVSLKRMWSISFTTSEDTKVYTRKGAKPIEFQRNKIINLGEFKIDGDYWYDEHRGIVKETQEVDLGLTIAGTGGKQYKVIFAKSNLTTTGLAENESDYGDYFAWGATEPWYDSLDRTSSSWKATWKTDKTTGYTEGNCPSYNNNDDYVGNNVLKMEYDPARKILEGEWQIPTQDIWMKLKAGSSYSWINTKQGYEFVNNDQALFLPAAGYVSGSSFSSVGFFSYYWSGTASSTDSADCLAFHRSAVWPATVYRYLGYSVRPVRLVEVPQSQQ